MLLWQIKRLSLLFYCAKSFLGTKFPQVNLEVSSSAARPTERRSDIIGAALDMASVLRGGGQATSKPIYPFQHVDTIFPEHIFLWPFLSFTNI